jgi:chromosome segregation ATPase
MTDKPKPPQGIPSLKPAKDEVASYRRSQAKNTRRAVPKQGNFNGMLVFVIVLMAIMMGIGGYTLYEVQKKLERSNILLAKGQENVIELERRLNATGTDVSKTLETIGKKIDGNLDEIRKLWDVSNKRNKKWIQDNQAAIKKVSGSIDKTVEGVSSVTQKLNGIATRFEKLNQDMVKLQRSITDENAEISTQITLVRGQVQDQIVELKGLARQMNLLANREKNTEEAIEAIDEHRRQLNIKISDLQKQVREMQQVAPTAIGG